MASFDDAYSTLSSSTGQLNKITRSQERLLDVRKTELQPITKQPEAENFLGKFRIFVSYQNFYLNNFFFKIIKYESFAVAPSLVQFVFFKRIYQMELPKRANLR